MPSYKIIVSGRGFDCKVFPLSEDQLEQLSEFSGDMEDALDEDTMNAICEITGKKFLENDIDYFDADKSLFGPNDSPGSYNVCVYDNDENMIFQSSENWLEEQFENDDEADDFQDEFWDEGKLLMAQNCKADFFEYELKLEEEFNPSKLRGGVTLIAETFSLARRLCFTKNH